VNCFYRLANPTTTAMQWEAVAINADFWSQVLQSQTLKPLDFALGAAILLRRKACKKSAASLHSQIASPTIISLAIAFSKTASASRFAPSSRNVGTRR
jgi:hypothetical protein